MNIIKLYWGESIPGNYTGIVELLSGENNNLCERRWYKEGKLHREDGPAFESEDGYKEWFKDGKYHRIDGPAIESESGFKKWYNDGKLHRIDGPAFELPNENYFWYINGDVFDYNHLNFLAEKSIFLGIEKGKYDLEWLKFMSEKGIKEYPIIPKMESKEDFRKLFQKLRKTQ